MEWQFTNEVFIEVTLADGRRIARPRGDFGGSAFVFMTLQDEGHDLTGATIRTVQGKWWVRLMEPGMIEATAWEGPFDTKDTARAKVGSA